MDASWRSMSSAMCCFSRHVEKVWSTRIFARPLDAGRQLLVYGMSLEVAADVAMILPIPVPPGTREDAVQFVDMSSRPTFFDDVSALFPQHRARARRASVLRLAPQPRRMLVVHDVGDFEASFVPSLRDFDRLDARFRLPGEVWEALPTLRRLGLLRLQAEDAAGQRPQRALRALQGAEAEPAQGPSDGVRVPAPRCEPALLPDGARARRASCTRRRTSITSSTARPTPAWEPLMEWERSASRADALAPGAQPWVDAVRVDLQAHAHAASCRTATPISPSRSSARAPAVSAMFRVRMRAAFEHVIDDGKTELEPRVKKWMRVSEAERIRIRDAVTTSSPRSSRRTRRRGA